MKLYRKTRLKIYLRSVLFGEKCVCCQRLDTKGESLLCPECEHQLRLSRFEMCMDCGRLVKDCLCSTAEASYAGCDMLIKYAFYEPSVPTKPINKIVHRLKRVKDKLLAAYMVAGLTKKVCELVGELGGTADNTLVVHIPRSAKKRRDAGHDQARLLAKEFSRRTSYPSRDVLVRVKEGKLQKTLSTKEREKNAHGMFAVRRGESVSGKIVIIVDDLVTSGATLAEATRLMLENGAVRVLAVSIAKNL